MARKLILLAAFAMLTLAGCATVQEGSLTSGVGASCSEDSDCLLPMDYAIQSNCPFGAACIDDKCRVVCPSWYHDPNPNVSKSYPVACKADTDCDCSWRGGRTIRCACIENKCLSIEDE